MPRRPAPTPDDLRQLDPHSEFLERLMDDYRALQALGDTHDLTPLKVIAHQLAGAAATFGYLDIGDVAIELDEHFRHHDVTAVHLARLMTAIEESLDIHEKSA